LRSSLIERDAESAWLSGKLAKAGALDNLIGHPITDRIAVGPRAGQKVFTVQGISAPPRRAGSRCTRARASSSQSARRSNVCAAP
jgi:hypothetical protein